MISFPYVYSRVQQMADFCRICYPRVLTWYVTARCNVSCATCIHTENAYFKDPKGDLSPKQATVFIDDLAALYNLYPLKPLVIVSGGEPLLRNDIFSLCARLEQKRLRYRLASNMTVCNASMIRELAKLRPEALGVSLDADAGHYADNRKGRMQFREVTDALDYYRSLNKSVPIKICYVVTNKNIGTMKKMPALIRRWRASLNICHLQFLSPLEKERYHDYARKIFKEEVNPMSGCVGDFDDAMAAEILRDIVETRKEARKQGVAVRFIPELTDENILRYYGVDKGVTPPGVRCLSHYYELRIAPNGEVYPCIQYSLGNIKTSSLRKILTGKRSRRYAKILRSHDIFPGCIRCGKKIFYKSTHEAEEVYG